MTSTLDGSAATVARAASAVASAGLSAVEAASYGLAGFGVPAARALGARAGEIRPHTAGSPNLVDGAFRNRDVPAESVDTDMRAAVDMVRGRGKPRRPVRVLTPEFPDTARSLAVTWLGHASALLEVDGVRILTDPVFTMRCSPSRRVGPMRMHESPVTVDDLPPVDVVLISHDHYDHLDATTVAALAARQPAAIFVAPIGVAAHLIRWGIAAERIRQADWWSTVDLTVGAVALTFTCTPARHFSGRALTRNLTQWASWVITGPAHRAFFSGDTGFTDEFEDVAARVGAVDLALIAVGAYDPMWPDVHVDPEEAVRIHRMLTRDKGSDAVMVPIHWGTFNLARHPWGEPVGRALSAGAREGVSVLVPPPGGTIDITTRSGTGLTDPTWWETSA